MLPALTHRVAHYALLLATSALLTVPNLGKPSLWDIDEGNNAEAAREMREAETWVKPTFNFQLRVDKPALLYWLQMSAYEILGVNEWAARLPSALAAMLAVLLAYELARRMFDAVTALVAGLILATSLAFAAAAHFANPDALLNLCTLLTLSIFWSGYARESRLWFVPAGVAAGLAVLAKGPVGLLLPSAVVLVFLLWSRRMRWVLDRRLGWGVLAFLLVALPWYIFVAVETKADFLRGFLLVHNVGRYLSPMEHHGGPVYYYLPVLLAGFVPWSVFLGGTAWAACGKRAAADGPSGAAGLPATYRFLWCWIAVYLLFFSFAGTKLPNYILPAYAPVAILTARFLVRWARGTVDCPAWAVHTGLACLALVGVGIAVGLLVAGGEIRVPGLRAPRLEGLERWAGLGAVPVLAAVAAAWLAWRGQRAGLIAAVAGAGVFLTGGLAAFAAPALDRHKAPRVLVARAGVARSDVDLRVGCYQYFQPSLVFYCQREVHRLENEADLAAFLRHPFPSYVFLPAATWEELRGRLPVGCRERARHVDLYRRCDVVVVSNR